MSRLRCVKRGTLRTSCTIPAARGQQRQQKPHYHIYTEVGGCWCRRAIWAASWSRQRWAEKAQSSEHPEQCKQGYLVRVLMIRSLRLFLAGVEGCEAFIQAPDAVNGRMAVKCQVSSGQHKRTTVCTGTAGCVKASDQVRDIVKSSGWLMSRFCCICVARSSLHTEH